MAMLDFSRGELSPSMRYRTDLPVYFKGAETILNFLPEARGGLSRRPGSQILEIIDYNETPSALNTINLGASGLDVVIEPPAYTTTLTVGACLYETHDRVHDIPKGNEMQVLLVFTEPNDIAAYWVNTPNRVPSYLGRVSNCTGVGTYERPTLGFPDTRDVRLVQIEGSVYIVAQTAIYRFYWDLDKTIGTVAITNYTWTSGKSYSKHDVVVFQDGTELRWFECILAHTSAATGEAANKPDLLGADDYWTPVYRPLLSWERVEARVGYELLGGAGIKDEDPYEWKANNVWTSDKKYVPGDVVEVSSVFYECITEHTTGTLGAETPASGTYSANWEALPAITDGTAIDPESAQVYLRSTRASKEETIPRSIKVHHNRLIMAGSSIRPATLFGSEVAHYLNFGAGINADEPWTFTLSGEKIGKILWLAVTDQLYIGTSGGLFAVSDVITPTSFQLRKVTSHAASIIEGISVSGNMVFFQSDRRTLREVAYSDQAENYQAQDLTLYSEHLFKDEETQDMRAIKITVTHNPTTTLWVLRAYGDLVSLTYEPTQGVFAFARHEFQGPIMDISSGVGDDLYAILDHETESYREVIRIGEIIINDDGEVFGGFSLDGLVHMVNTDPSAEFAGDVPHEAWRTWLEAQGVESVTDMRARDAELDATGQEFGGDIRDMKIYYLEDIVTLKIADTGISGAVPSSMSNCEYLETLDLSNNLLTHWEAITLPSNLSNINLSGNSFDVGQLKRILVAVHAHATSNEIEGGTLNLSGMPIVEYGNGLTEARALVNELGWTVNLANTGTDWRFSVTYSANGGTGTLPEAGNVSVGEPLEVAVGSTLSREGYRFTGWNTAANGSGASYAPAATFILEEESAIVLYAMWEVVSSVSYRAANGQAVNGSPPTDTTAYAAGEPVIVKGPGTMTRTHYTFVGWNTEANLSGIQYREGDTVLMDGDGLQFYSVWTENNYSVTFNGNGAFAGALPATITLKYGSTVTIPAATMKKKEYQKDKWIFTNVLDDFTWEVGGWRSYDEHFTHDEWSTMSNGTGTNYKEGDTFVLRGNVTLYPKWRDYRVGDIGPGGGKIFFDYGKYFLWYLCYATRNWGTNKDWADVGVFRYLEAAVTDQGAGSWSNGRRFTINGYSDWELPRIYGDYSGKCSNFIKYLYDRRVDLGLSFNYSNYWCYEYQNKWWSKQGFRCRLHDGNRSYSDGNGNSYGYRPIRKF